MKIAILRGLRVQLSQFTQKDKTNDSKNVQNIVKVIFSKRYQKLLNMKCPGWGRRTPGDPPYQPMVTRIRKVFASVYSDLE